MPHARHPRERARTSREVGEVALRRIDRDAAAVERFGNHETRLIGDWKTIDEEGVVDDGHRHGHADADRENRGRGDREAGRTPKAAKRDAQILPELFHASQDTQPDVRPEREPLPRVGYAGAAALTTIGDQRKIRATNWNGERELSD